MEAFTCRTPIIIHRTGGSVESAADCCIVGKGDISSMLHIISNNKAELRKSMDVSIEKIMKNYYKVYNLMQ